MTVQTEPRQAASVILLRPAPTRGFEVFLTRRTSAMPVLGGMYCYPGGTVKREDSSKAMLERCIIGATPFQAQGKLNAQFGDRDAFGIRVAAVRELFEEAGVLLAVEESGERFTPERARLERYHRLMAEGLSFLELLRAEKFSCDLTALAYFSHWRTPPQVPARFDTWFFLAALPEGQSPLEGSSEVAHGLWLSPDLALKKFHAETLPMIFPTFAALRTLADFETLEALFKEYGPPKPDAA